MNIPKIITSLQKFQQKNVLVIGDIMLDEYIQGKVDRISPEAPVPVVTVLDKKYCLGGSANVALNVNALKANVFLVGIVGQDDSGKKVLDLLKKKKLDTSGIYVSKYRRTTLKTRVMSSHQQMLRIDTEDVVETNETELNQLQSIVKHLLTKENIHAVIFEDYDKGCIKPYLIDFVMDICRKKDIFVAVDPKRNNFFDYRQVSLFKPNLKETKDALGMDVEVSLTGLRASFKALNAKLSLQNLLITLSKSGVFYANSKKSSILPAFVRNISDVSGAGDTVISWATLAMISGLSIEEAAWISNLAGGMVCEKSGVDVIDQHEMESELKRIQAGGAGH